METPSLRIGSLLGRVVVDADGVTIGHVHDVRLRRDGPILPGFGPALRVDALIVGPGSFAPQLGLNRSRITGPWPLDVFARRARRRLRFVPWESVQRAGDDLQTTHRFDQLAGVDE
jgi:sporulation protein YlmC with PRC-barrel domain